MRKRILLIYTGGTIGMVHDGAGALVPMDFGSIRERLPALDSVPVELEIVALERPMDSSDMTPDVWAELARIIVDRRDAAEGVVVLHGTDTMAFTASALSFMLEGLERPVVLTGAQRPMTAVRGDARENLVTAVAIAADPRAPREVMICFDDVLLRGNRATKVAADRFDAFSSPNFPPLARAGVEIRFARPGDGPPPTDGVLRLRTTFEPSVTALRLFPGLGEQAVRHALQAPGVVLQTFGAGNAPSAPWLLDAIAEAAAAGTVVVNVTQCLEGTVSQGRYATGLALERAGVVGGHDLTFEAAITKLMLLLGEDGADRARELMPVPLAGELTPP